MKLVELFCGCGGFSRGAHAAGFEVAVAYDIDPILTSSYRTNFPNTRLLKRDVGKLSGKKIERDVGGRVFGVFGGPPCQGFSEIGKRNPDDPRRELLGHFFRIVAELKPAFFVMENVRGLAYPGAKPVLDAALKAVEDDYDLLGPVVWDASKFGAATKRHRMFVIGIRKELGKPLVLDHMTPYLAAPATVADAIGDIVGAVGMKPLKKSLSIDRWRLNPNAEASDYAKRLRCKDGTFTGHLPTTHTASVLKRFAAVKPGEYDKIGRHPRLDPAGQCPTLRAGTGVEKGSFQSVRPIHPTLDRVITVREAARLQGFPDEHVFHPTIWHSFRMIGNSVSPIMARAVFDAIRERLGLRLSADGYAYLPVPEPEPALSIDAPPKGSVIALHRFRKEVPKMNRFAARRKKVAGR